jgi:dihydroxyacetone kinase-like protein
VTGGSDAKPTASSESVSLADAAPILFDLVAVIVREQGKLSEIDGQTGDGDHGVNMGKGFRLAGERLRALGSFTFPQGLNTLGDTLLSDIGGSMGPLYGTFFTDMAEVLNGADALNAARFSAMLKAGLTAVQGLGDAKPGDKTLVDVLSPAGTAFDSALASGQSFAESLRAMKESSAAGLEATRGMVAKVGRASRLGERSRGTLDAGATSCDMILATLADGLIQRLTTGT